MAKSGEEFYENLGIPANILDEGYEPEDRAPDASTDVIFQMIRGELDRTATSLVRKAIAIYPNWRDAYREVLEDDTDFEVAIERIRGHLKEGGPPVDYAAIHLYERGDLDEEETRIVRRRIVTWKTWNNAYWEVAITLIDDEDDTKTVPPQSETDVPEWVREVVQEKLQKMRKEEGEKTTS